MDNAISVTQVNNYIKSIFDAEFMLQNIFVYGEIGSYKVTNGIAYFNLKDENSLISCVLFNANNFPNFDVGSQVVVRGSINYYAKGGKLNFNAVSIESFGVGVLYQKFLELKAELEAKGYFDTSVKKVIPERVKRIGVVTSETGAVIRDIIDVTHRRNDSIDIVLYPVKVQGLGAEKEIANGINFFSEYDNIDVVIVARGGGSMEDLQPYNTKIVAEATFNCKKPIVSAVGHETDFTIIDFVSDMRAPTPSAAAEIVSYPKINDLNILNEYLVNISKMTTKIISQRLKEIDYLFEKCNNGFDRLIRAKIAVFGRFMVENDRKVNDVINSLIQAINDIKTKVVANDYKSLVNKGFTRIFKGGKVVKSIDNLQDNDIINFDLIDGRVGASVVLKETNNGV